MARRRTVARPEGLPVCPDVARHLDGCPASPDRREVYEATDAHDMAHCLDCGATSMLPSGSAEVYRKAIDTYLDVMEPAE